MTPSYPLFFQSGDGLWLQPIPIYLTALFGTSAPLVVGALDVALLYFAAARLMKSQWAAGLTAAVLLLFPAHAIFSRQAGDAIYPLPFVITWIICLLSYFDRPRPWLLFTGGLCLGAGVYTQPSAPITMTFLLVVGLGAMWLEGHRSPASVAPALAGFVVPLLLMVPWFAMYPDTYQDTMGRWAIHKAHIRSPLEGLRAFVNWNTLSTRTSLYWESFNPAFWLFGDPSVMHGRAPMLVAVAVFALMGIKRVLSGTRASLAFLLLAGLAVSPMAASTFGQHYALDSALSMVVFISLLGGLGVWEVLESRRTVVRAVGAALLVAIPLQYLLG